MTDFMRLRRAGPADWRVTIPGVGESRSLTVSTAPVNARALASRKLGVHPETVEVEIVVAISDLAAAPDMYETADLLVAALAGMGMALADVAKGWPCDTMRRYGQFGWLRDGTPVIYLK